MVTAVISVTKNDIAKGEKGNTQQCALARALHRAGFKKVDVSLSLFPSGSGVEVVELPQVAQDFIESFDDCLPVKPFKFTLKVSNANAKKLGYKALAKAA